MGEPVADPKAGDDGKGEPVADKPLMGDDAAKKKFEETKAKAEKGDKFAQYELGQMCRLGEGVPEDDKEAAKWYRKAAEQGVAAAQHLLGLLCDAGQGVPEDDKEAVKWLRKAAEQGVARAQFNLGRMYYKGQGVLVDDVTTYAWWNIAATNGHETAKKSKPMVAKFLTADQIAKAEKLSREMIKKNPKLIKKRIPINK